jgi:hypothetical protein
MNCSSRIKQLGLLSFFSRHGGRGGLYGCGQASGSPAPALAKSHLPETSHDFGQVSEEQELLNTLVMENTGKVNLAIDQVIKDCKCTAAFYDRIIPPGGSGEITLTIKPYTLLGQIQNHTTINSKDPDGPEAVFTLQGVSQRPIEFVPGRLIRLWGNLEEDLRCTARVISPLPLPLNIKEFPPDIPDKIEAFLEVEEPGRIYALAIEVSAVRLLPLLLDD